MRTSFGSIGYSFLSYFFLLSSVAFSQEYLSEKFNGNSLPTSWTVTDQGTGACRWMIHAPYYNSDNTTQITMLGSNFLFVDSDSGGSSTVANEAITSPGLTIPAASTVFIQFDHFFRGSGVIRQDTGYVEVYNGTAWVTVKKYYQSLVGSGTNPVNAKLDVSAYVNPDFKIRFRYVARWGYFWAIDNVSVFSPSAADAGVISMSGPANPACGLGSPFQVKIKIANFGTAAQSNFPVSYRVNNLAPVSETFTGSLPAGDTADFTFATPFSASAPGTYSFSSWTSLTGDGAPNNDTLSNKKFQRAVSGLLPVNLAQYSGGNLSTILPGWSEQSGLVPSGGTSSWTAPSASQVAALGSNTAKINLFSTSKKEWIISPAFNPVAGSALRFRVAVTNYNNIQPDSMDATDSLIVKVSTDCGQTWTRVKWFTKADNLTNQLVTQLVSLNDYAGKTIRFAYYATEGATFNGNDYDVHIDRMELLVPSPADLGLTALVLPFLECGVPSSLPLKVRIFNNGTQTQTSLPVSFSVDGQTPVSETFSGSLAPGATAEFTFTSPMVFSTSGTHTISAWTHLSGDLNFLNDSVRNIEVKRFPASFTPVAFTGYDGVNLAAISPGWKEATGANPSGTTSAWSQSNAAQVTSLGSLTARINLYANSKRDWLISPPINVESGYALRFKAAVTDFVDIGPDSMGSDDSVVVKVTTDCGQSWTRIKAFTKTDRLPNQLTNQLVSLAAFAGQNIQIGFFATEGTVNDNPDYDFHLDDIEVSIPSAQDLGLSAFILPTGECGVPSSVELKVKVFNYGSQTLTSLPLTYQIGAQAPVSETFSLNLTPGGNGVVTFSTPMSFPTSGTYSLSAWSSLAGDLNKQNDSLRNFSLVRKEASFPINTFTGFNGTNLATVFPGWKEQRGTTPAGTISSWSNSANNQTTALGSLTARVSLSGNTNREWLISPPFSPVGGQVLKFKAAVTTAFGITPDTLGIDDSVHVMASTDCGLSWKKLKSISRETNLSNTLRDITVPLGAFTGQSLLIGFYATNGSVNDPFNSDFHLDNVQVITAPMKDLGVTGMVLPNTSCSAPATLNLVIQITNNGGESQVNFPVAYQVNGASPVSETFADTLRPGQTRNFTFSSPIDLSATGTFLISAWTSLPGDVDAGNDSLRSVPLVTPASSFATVTFTNFTGPNLSALFPGWTQQSGQQPAGTTSLWVNSTGSQTTALGSATARVSLFSNTRREWLESPVFIAGPNTTLKFRLAVTAQSFSVAGTLGSDDSLNVMISTNCGQTWSRLRSFTKANNLTNQLTAFSVDLAAFAGQGCRVAFFATEGTVDDPGAVDLHLDDIQVSTVTGVLPLSGSDVRLYPNPAREEVFVEGAGNALLQLFSSDGKLVPVETTVTAEGRIRLHLKGFPPGMYRLRIVSEGRSVSRNLAVGF